ncbi:hypothetical protein GCM10007977_001620 [Dactylosporangium sucinum]|uniref:Uncharacterized protein n=1 Tax=Dactylosporangium sucinum TaxID=1424081 RepID=A0A917SZS8_9ACTN|nr:hypothetical protein GCM10007977_001620 [Dactylosporangium sucinum]
MQPWFGFDFDPHSTVARGCGILDSEANGLAIIASKAARHGWAPAASRSRTKLSCGALTNTPGWTNPPPRATGAVTPGVAGTDAEATGDVSAEGPGVNVGGTIRAGAADSGARADGCGPAAGADLVDSRATNTTPVMNSAPHAKSTSRRCRRRVTYIPMTDIPPIVDPGNGSDRSADERASRAVHGTCDQFG